MGLFEGHQVAEAALVGSSQALRLPWDIWIAAQGSWMET